MGATKKQDGREANVVWWVHLRIELQLIGPGCPQQNGRQERMHRTLKEATAQPPRANLATQQKTFEAFRREYNEERPHESLGQRPPAGSSRVSFTVARAKRLSRSVGEADGTQGRSDEVEGRRDLSELDLAGAGDWIKPVGAAKRAVYFETLELGLFEERRGRILSAKRLQRKPVTP